MKKKTGVAKQAEHNRKDAHVLDERVKALHQSIHSSHQDAKQFHLKAAATKRNTEVIISKDHQITGLTEKDLQRSADEQQTQLSLIGNRALGKRKSA